MIIFKIFLSSGGPIKISETELPTVMEGLQMRAPVIVTKNGVFNAAYYTNIEIDEDETKNITEKIENCRLVGTQYQEPPSEFARILGSKTKILK